MSTRLAGKIALITGGSSGIGLATAKIFQKEGAKVVITGRNQAKLDGVVKEIGGDIFAVQSDTAKVSDIDDLIAKIKERYGKIDVLFLNAGAGEPSPIETTTEADFDKVVNINLKGIFFTVQKAIPLLNQGASIILTCSCIHLMGQPGNSVYSATKAGVRSLARSMSAELKDRGIRVNSLSPGAIRTPMLEEFMHYTGTEKEEFTKMLNIPLGRLGESEEIAKTALFLASDDSSYILGADIIVDGGMSQL
jgi:NAD(P)-dependent dehydrogenase (short-subunit alcohol dehydrogenase family)